MWASEDSADDEFVFVANKTVRVIDREGNGWTHTPQPRRPHAPRLNQPIPTTLELGPAPGPRTWPASVTTTTARSRATPLPPELIELLPEHLRENTVPDYTANTITTTTARTRPHRPPLPTGYSSGDYCNLEDLITSSTHTTSNTTTPKHPPTTNYDFLSELSELVSWDIKPASQDQSVRSGSVSLTRPAVRTHPTPTTASNTAPAALALTDSGISSGSSSSSSGGSSSVSSRSSSNKSLVKEGCVTTQGGRQWQPLSPKFNRDAPNTTPTPTTSIFTPSPSHHPPASTSDQVAKNEEKNSTSHHHEVSNIHSPLVHHFRAANISGDVCVSEYGGQLPHTRHVTSAYTTITGDSQANLSHTPNSLFIVEDSPPVEQGRSSVRGVSGSKGGVRTSPAPRQPMNCTPKQNPHPHPNSAYNDVRATTPPSSPELRRAWNVVGVPPAPRVDTGRGSPVLTRTRHGSGSHSDPDVIYDNLIVRRSPTPPHSSTNLSSRRRFHDPHDPVVGKPPSPPMQRRASRSPTPASSSRPSSPQCLAYHPSQDMRQAGCWVNMWGSSPHLCQEATGTHYYPTCVYNVPPPPPPCSLVCGARSHSCDRLPVRPSPPSSPTPYNSSGRRSPSPWRSGSASPAPPGSRHSPSPDRTSGRPPRPRRPPHRKSKTVEVGYLGLTSPPPPPHLTHLPGPPPPTTPTHSSIRALSYLPVQPLSSTTTTTTMCGQSQDRHMMMARQQYNHNMINDHHCVECDNGDVLEVGCHQQQQHHHHHHHCNTTPCVTPTPYNGPMCLTSPCVTPPPLSHPSPVKELTNGTKHKVTYKSSIYKCMKNLLRPTH
ncbi:hypothetical protein Pmani_008874 [Petrolisthes manimaculis]|uniref:Uncharacterized protein n=1 Tax=Petrolisthes manimaculis TaxID=1843537 RepID=A0AAE1Q4T8_9EUCA|nr:hypothetical protein Pmani_008874 [Petrolisthes manimaculis]